MLRIARSRTPTAIAAAALLLLAAAGCVQPPATPVTDTDAWGAGGRAIDSLLAANRVDPALGLARRRAAFARAGLVPQWRAALALEQARALERRAGFPPDERAALAGADRALLEASFDSAGDSLSATAARCRAAWGARLAVLGPRDLATADAALALAEAEFALAHVRESDSLAVAAESTFRATLGPDHPRVADAEDLQGRLIKNFTGRLGFVAARRHYQAALVIRAAAYGPGSAEVATSLHDLANLYRLQGRSTDAYALFAATLDIRRHAPGVAPDDIASTLGGMAFLRAGDGHWADAAVLVRDALARTPVRRGTASGSRAVRLGLYGQALRRMGRDDEAVPVLREALAARESIWARSPRDASSSIVAGFGLYRDLAVALARTGNGDEAFEQLERGAARSLIARAAADPGGGPDPWLGLLARVQHRLADDEAIVSWPRNTTTLFVADYPMFACIVRRTGPVTWVRLDRRAPEYPRLGTVREALWTELRAATAWPRRVEDTGPVTQLAHAMWREYFAPLEPALRGVDRLVVCSPDLFVSGPLGALRDDQGRYLAERFTISYAPSALLWVRERETAGPGRPWSRPALIVGDPTYPAADPGNWSRLAASVGEIRDLAQRLPGATMLEGDAASAGRLRAMSRSGELARFGVLHFAAHTEIDPNRVLESALVLAPDTPGVTSRLTAREIAADWRLDADLVCLATCRSVAGMSSSTEGLLGLQQAFLAAGARALLVTLWPVDDEASALLMFTFYSRLTDRTHPATPAEALRDAQRTLRMWTAPDGRQPYAHPAYWAAFAVMGAG